MCRLILNPQLFESDGDFLAVGRAGCVESVHHQLWQQVGRLRTYEISVLGADILKDFKVRCYRLGVNLDTVKEYKFELVKVMPS